MRQNGRMAAPALAPRRTTGGIVAVWVVGRAHGHRDRPLRARRVARGVARRGPGRLPALAFAVQLAYGRSQGYIQRVAISVLGALLVMGVISLGFGLASIVPG